MSPRPTRDQAIEAIRAVALTLGRAPTWRDWNRLRARPSGTTLRRLFGTFNKAIEAAGLTANYKPVARGYSSSNAEGNLLIGGDQRRLDGCITTWENESGQLLTLHCAGARAVEQAAEAALERDPTYRLVSYCTPQSIFTDLSGRRAIGRRVGTRESPKPLPEKIMLSQVGLGHLIHPRLARKRMAA